MMSFWMVPVSLAAVGALLVGDRDVERQQPRRRGVDGHRRVHLRRAECRRAARACRRGARPARRPCRPRRAPARGRRRSRSASADRRRWRGRSGPWRGSCGRARWIWPRSNGPRRCGTARACRAPAVPPRGRARLGRVMAPLLIRNREMASLARLRASASRSLQFKMHGAPALASARRLRRAGCRPTRAAWTSAGDQARCRRCCRRSWP